MQWRIFRRDGFNNCFRSASGITRLVSVSFHRASPRAPGGLVVNAQRLAGHDERSAEKISPKRTWFHDGDANSQRRDFFRERLGKTLDCELGGIIDTITRYADESSDGRKVDYVSAPAVSKMRQYRLRNAQQTEDIGFKDVRDFSVVGLLNRAEQAVTSVADEHVNATKTGERSLDGGGDLPRFTQVHRHREQPIRRSLDSRDDLLRIP